MTVVLKYDNPSSYYKHKHLSIIIIREKKLLFYKGFGAPITVCREPIIVCAEMAGPLISVCYRLIIAGDNRLPQKRVVISEPYIDDSP